MSANTHETGDEALIDPALLDVLLRAREPMTIEALALQRAVDRQAVDRQAVDRQAVDRQAVDRQAVDRQAVDRQAVRAELERLRAAGSTFDEHPQHGVQLIEAGLGTWVDYLRHTLGDHRPIEVYQRTGSTQDACRRLALTHGRRGNGAIVAAHEQTDGRGRLGRKWIAPPGATLTFSRACIIEHAHHETKANPKVGPERVVDWLTFAASVAIASAAEALIGAPSTPHHTVQIKWPNDVCVGGRKLAGILVETCELERGARAAILGVGLNVGLWPREATTRDPELAARVTNLAAQGARADRLLVLTRVIRSLDAALSDALEEAKLAALLEQWRNRCTQLEQPIRVRSDGRIIEGRVIDLDPHEGLIVRSDSGEIVHLPAATTTVC